jgi:hypothetical protein
MRHELIRRAKLIALVSMREPWWLLAMYNDGTSFGGLLRLLFLTLEGVGTRKGRTTGVYGPP